MYGVSKLWIVLMILNLTYAQEAPCREGRYGHNCQHSCSERCLPLFYQCDARTGRCTEGCMEGYWGDKCDRTCSCLSNICQQHGGECLGTVKTTTQKSEKTTTSTTSPVHDGCPSGWRITAIVFIILLLLAVVTINYMIFYIRMLRKQVQLNGSEVEMERAGETVDSINAQQPLLSNSSAGPATNEMTVLRKQLEKYKKRVQDLEKRHNMTLGYFNFPLNHVYHLMGKLKIDRSSWLQCPSLKFDEELVNTRVALVDDNKVLWNIPDPRNSNGERRFQHFCGTSCTYPLKLTGFNQYFEADFDIQLNKPIEMGEVVMELGFCEKDDRDVAQFTQGKKQRYSLIAMFSKEHNKTSLMTIQGNKRKETGVKINNIIGSKTSISVGIHVNKEMKWLHFFDLGKQTLFGEMKLDSPQELWPMFGVGAQTKAQVNVRLISGLDVVLSKEKRELLKV